MMTDITIKLDQYGDKSAEVKGVARHGSIETPRSPGGRNITHYTVTIAGHEVEGTWADDARYNTTVRLAEDHPLYQPAMLIAEAQQALRWLREFVATGSKGWQRDEWIDKKSILQQEYYAAKAAVEANGVAQEMLGNLPVSPLPPNA